MVNGWLSWGRSIGSIDKAILTVLEEQAENLVKAISAWKKYSHQWHGWVFQ